MISLYNVTGRDCDTHSSHTNLNFFLFRRQAEQNVLRVAFFDAISPTQGDDRSRQCHVMTKYAMDIARHRESGEEIGKGGGDTVQVGWMDGKMTL